MLNEGAEGDEFRHYNLVIGNDTYEIQGAEKKFSSIFDLLNFYQTVPVDHKVSTIGVCLKCTKKSTNYDPIRPLPPSPRIGYPSELHTYSKVYMHILIISELCMIHFEFHAGTVSRYIRWL